MFPVNTFTESKVDLDKVYAIEWRDSDRKPKSGWKCYDGVVVDISTRKSFLEEKLSKIDGKKSPHRSVDRSRSPHRHSSGETHHKNEKGSRSVKSPRKDEKKNKSCYDNESNRGPLPSNASCSKTDPLNVHRTLSFSESVADHLNDDLILTSTESSGQTSKIGGSGVRVRSNEAVPPKKLYPIDLDKLIQDRDKTIDELKRKIDRLEEKIDAVNRLNNMSKPSTSGQRPVHHTRTSTAEKNPARPLSINEIEIGRPGSGIIITPEQWDAAQAKNTFTAMGTSLLMAVVDVSILLESNLKGEKSKIKQSTTVHKGLDSQQLAAIKCIKDRFIRDINIHILT
ncbi:uncharacterized protein LOC130668905 [Microplitis mediator]|uniref:uncharacterized protein LOC130668905 n=1 Tax=Microplitis mediator TaxID=375433 RepID=UPI002552CC73|nr:uncharacterized protein LOC130668905 [Microplitis mediator]